MRIIKNKYKFFLFIIFIIFYANIDNEIYTKIHFKKKDFLYYFNKIQYKGKYIFKEKLINDYLYKVSEEFKSAKDREKLRLNKFFNLAEYSDDSKIKTDLKDKFLKEISILKNQTITKLDTFFFSYSMNFGNSLIQINNAIFYCEIVDCNTIILNKNNTRRRWLIIKDIYIEKFNITIYQGSNVDCNNINIFCFSENSFDPFYPKVILPKIRTESIKRELLENLPKVVIDPEALYIHIRGGDIFKYFFLEYYSQPPLCFYENLINNQNFSKIYIVSIDNSNVVVDVLTKKYKNIIHKKNNLEFDISLLCHAFHIALSVSSFVISAIKLNDNLKDIWEFDIMRLSEKLLFLHHHLFKFKIQYKIYTMKPSDIYLSKMFYWRKSEEQIKLMLEDNCPYDFILTEPNT